LKSVTTSRLDRPVALVRYQESLYETLRRGIDLIGGLGHIRSPVLVKPNICTIKDGTGASVTDVEVVRAVIQILLHSDPSASIRVVESDSQSKFAMEAFQKFGYGKMVDGFLKKGADVGLVDLSSEPLVRAQMNGEYFEEIELHETLTNPHSLISVAVAKTHYLTFITGALKNLFGLLPRKDQSFYHSRIDSVIADLARFVTADLSIVDARTAIEGWNGPGTKVIGAFVIGRDPVSVDSVLTRLLGFRPEQVSHLRKLGAGGLGSLDPMILGETVDSLSVKLKAPKG
jgi:uncharacterized protein (DUF362 family)